MPERIKDVERDLRPDLRLFKEVTVEEFYKVMDAADEEAIAKTFAVYYKDFSEHKFLPSRNTFAYISNEQIKRAGRTIYLNSNVKELKRLV